MHQPAPKETRRPGLGRNGGENGKTQAKASHSGLFLHTPVPTVILSKDLRIVEATGSFHDEFGYAPAETQGRFLADFLHPADRKPVAAFLRRKPVAPKARKRKDLLAPEAAAFAEARFLHQSQIWRHVRIAVGHAPGSDEGERVAVLEDITGRKQAEQNWRIMSGVFERALQGMAQYDSHGNHVQVN
ncbi:MAG TPA: PAS domain-containing protein, partial [Candidatus Methylacidiphilales bacterium]